MLELQLEPKRNTFRDDVFVMLKMWLNFMQEVFWTNKHTAKVGLRCNSLCKYMQYGSLHTNITYLVYFVSFCCFEASVVALIVHGFLTCYEPTECSRMVVYYFWWIVQRETLWKHVETVILGHLWTMYWDPQRSERFCVSELRNWPRPHGYTMKYRDISGDKFGGEEKNRAVPFFKGLLLWAVTEHTIKAVWTCLPHVSHRPSDQK